MPRKPQLQGSPPQQEVLRTGEGETTERLKRDQAHGERAEAESCRARRRGRVRQRRPAEAREDRDTEHARTVGPRAERAPRDTDRSRGYAKPDAPKRAGGRRADDSPPGHRRSAAARSAGSPRRTTTAHVLIHCATAHAQGAGRPSGLHTEPGREQRAGRPGADATTIYTHVARKPEPWTARLDTTPREAGCRTRAFPEVQLEAPITSAPLVEEENEKPHPYGSFFSGR